MSDLVSVIEAIYRVDLPGATWLGEILTAARPLFDHGLGVWGGTYRACAGGIEFETLAARGVRLPGWMTLARRSGPHLGAASMARSVFSRTFGNAREMLPNYDDLLLARGARAFGIEDAVGFNALDPSGYGVLVSAPMGARASFSEGSSERWSRVAVHLGAACRLRRRFAGDPTGTPVAVLDHAAAVLDPGGRVVHATAAAAAPETRAMLRGAATAIDRARARLRRQDPDEALAQWRAMVDARWSIIDHYDRDGRRYVIARQNQPEPRLPGSLTLRERQVVGFAALGRSNKLIAYELGLSESAIATHLSNAAKKLGLHSRVELVRSFAGTFTAPKTNGPC